METYHEVSPDGDVVLNLVIYHPKDQILSAESREARFGGGFPFPEQVLETVRIRVSSLKLNPYPAFVELCEKYVSSSQTLSGSTCVGSPVPTEIPLKDDDPTAMLLLVKIIHGNITEAPFVDSNTLSELAILLAKYNVDSLRVRAYYCEWRRAAPDLNPRDITRMLLYLCLSWLFRDEYTFHDLSKQLILESPGTLTTDLPIPGYILACIEQKRQLLIRTILGQVEKFPTLIRREETERIDTEPHVSREEQPNQDLGVPPKIPCCTECDARLRSGYIRGLRTLGLDPAPEMPYNRISANNLIERLRDMPLPSCGVTRESIDDEKYFYGSKPTFCLNPKFSRVGCHCLSRANTEPLKEMLNAAVKSCESLWLHEFTN